MSSTAFDDRTDASTSDFATTFTGEAITEESESWLASSHRASAIRSGVLLALLVFSLTTALFGGFGLFSLLITRSFSPAIVYYEKPLYFDYTQADAVAVAHFLPAATYKKANGADAAAAQASFLPSGQRFDLWLELAIPEAHGQQGDELFQVTGEIFTANAQSIEKASRPCLVRQRYWISRTVRLWLNAPFVILGLWDERREFKVELFIDHKEDATTPFSLFQATLQASAGGGRLPQLYDAKVHIQLRLGILAWLLNLVWYRQWAWILWILSFLMLLGGSTGSVGLWFFWVATSKGPSSDYSGTGHAACSQHDTTDIDGDLSGDESVSAEDLQGVEQELEDEKRRNTSRQRNSEGGSSRQAPSAAQRRSQPDARRDFHNNFEPSKVNKKIS